MKTGDLVYCIKDRGSLNIKDRIYKIIEIDYDKDTIKISVEKNIYHISSHFRIRELDDYKYYIFQTHFDTLKNIRKDKLKKLKYEN